MTFIPPLLQLLGLVGLLWLAGAPRLAVRVLPLGLIALGALAPQLLHPARLDPLRVVLIVALLAVSCLIDYKAATLRAWAYRATSKGAWGGVIGGFLGLFFALDGTFITGFIVGTILGCIIGELLERTRGGGRLFRSVLGGLTGLWGIGGWRLLLGLQIIALT